MANRSRRSHQRAQTAPWTESLSLSRRCWHATVGGPGGDCRQSDQYRSIPGSNEQRIEIKPRAAITKRGKRKDGDKMAARKEPTGWVQGIASPRSLFLRRKVARPPLGSPGSVPLFQSSAAKFRSSAGLRLPVFQWPTPNSTASGTRSARPTAA